ncbi:MAG TPA: sulfite exporter TauE/SafE family protein [Acidimicrobiales bacterium]
MLLAVTTGAAVQGSVGFGANLIAVPVLALVEPHALPATLTLLVMPLAVGMAWRERHRVDRAGVVWLMVGRLPGTALGAAVVAAVSGDALSVLLGAAVLVAVVMSLRLLTVPVTPATTVGAGAASGAMGTATAIGGPPAALLYQHHEGPVLRSTLAVVFAVGTMISLGAQAVAGVVAAWHLVLAAALLPGTIAGLLASGAIARRIDGRHLRPAVLTFAAATAAAAIVRGLL